MLILMFSAQQVLDASVQLQGRKLCECFALLLMCKPWMNSPERGSWCCIKCRSYLPMLLQTPRINKVGLEYMRHMEFCTQFAFHSFIYCKTLTGEEYLMRYDGCWWDILHNCELNLKLMTWDMFWIFFCCSLCAVLWSVLMLSSFWLLLVLAVAFGSCILCTFNMIMGCWIFNCGFLANINHFSKIKFSWTRKRKTFPSNKIHYDK